MPHSMNNRLPVSGLRGITFLIPAAEVTEQMREMVGKPEAITLQNITMPGGAHVSAQGWLSWETTFEQTARGLVEGPQALRFRGHITRQLRLEK